MRIPLPSLLLLLLGSTLAFVVEPTSRRSTHLAAIPVALTREEGKNDKLRQALLADAAASGVEPCELPCIAHADGPDLIQLEDSLTNEDWDYVVVTSPEAARVLSSAWRDDSQHKVAAVGKATEQTLHQLGIAVSFCPSKATAQTLVVELPLEEGGRILYPASCRAATTLQDGLAQRGMRVTRLNTYDTVTATWTEEERATASDCPIACFASPSSIQGWLQNTDNNNQVLAACIGETSAEACRKHGWSEERIFYPEKPGIEGWVEAIRSAVAHLTVVHEG